jgi:formylglycine-generating enzyme required for sulfatase activity
LFINERFTSFLLSLHLNSLCKIRVEDSYYPTPDNLIFVEGGTVAGITVYDFYIDKYEITNEKWSLAMGSGNKDKYPKTEANWFDAIEYCNRRRIFVDQRENRKVCRNTWRSEVRLVERKLS